jgi:opacity protein-like surface antigen
VQAENWALSGLYTGLELGSSSGTTKVIVTPATGNAGTVENSKTAIGYGGFVGFSWAFDNGIYVGAELAANRGTDKGKRATLIGADTRERAHLDATLSLRAGIVWDENIAIYGIGGVAQRDASYSLPPSRRAQEQLSGTTFGLGGLYALDDNFFARVEWTTTDFGKKDFMTTGSPSVTYEPKSTRFSIGLAYSF